MLKAILEEVQLSESVYNLLTETVSKNCADGAGVATQYGGWQIIRTWHLDKPRLDKPDVQRDAGYDCKKFQDVISLFLKHKRITIRKGKYNLMYKEGKYYEEAVIEVRPEMKQVVFVTIMSLDKEKQSDYRNPKKERRIFIGKLN